MIANAKNEAAGVVITMEPIINKLTDFIAQWGAVLQHSERWLKERGDVVTGTGMVYVVGGYSPFGNRYKYKLEKAGLGDKFEHNAATDNGTIHETIVRTYTGQYFDTNIIGDKIYISPPDVGVGVSPDGYGVVKISKILERAPIGYDNVAALRIESPDNIAQSPDSEYECVMFEFKCPYSRRLGRTVPAYYVPQVKSGLAMSPPASLGLFVETMIRRCSLDQLGLTPGYIPNGSEQPLKTIKAIACGVMLLMVPPETVLGPEALEDYTRVKELCMKKGSRPGSVDINLCSTQTVLELYREAAKYGNLLEYGPICYTKAELMECLAGVYVRDDCYGVLGWKMIKYAAHAVAKEINYIAANSGSINKFLSEVSELKSMDEESRRKIKEDYEMVDVVGGSEDPVVTDLDEINRLSVM